MEPAMNPNIMMFVRYGIAAGIAFAHGKGWISAPNQGALVDIIVQAGGALGVAFPAIYAALKINNKPKPT